MRAYGKLTGDYSLQERVDVQTGLKMILNLCLTDGFDMFPSLLVTDGSCMIDRRMGIHGHPLEIQVSITMLCFLILLCFALSAICIWKLCCFCDLFYLKLMHALFYLVTIALVYMHMLLFLFGVCDIHVYTTSDINVSLLNTRHFLKTLIKQMPGLWFYFFCFAHYLS